MMKQTKTVKVGDLEIQMDVTAYVKWENRAKRDGMTVAQALAFFLSSSGTTNL